MSRDVATVDERTPFLTAVGMMRTQDVGSVVATRGRPPRKTGILTHRDVKRVVSQVDQPMPIRGRLRTALGVLVGRRTDKPLASLTVEDCMQTTIETVQPSMTISNALVRMRAEDVTHLAVTDKMRLEGILSADDVAHAHDEIVREVRTVNARRPKWLSREPKQE